MITTLAEPCWHLTGDDEVESHYGTKAAAVKAHDDGDGMPVQAQRYPAPCKTLACAGCGELAEDDDIGGTIHFPPGFEPDPTFTGFETFGGQVLCEPCVEKAQRDELRKVGG